VLILKLGIAWQHRAEFARGGILLSRFTLFNRNRSLFRGIRTLSFQEGELDAGQIYCRALQNG
jgi:hypothetical protein